MGYTPPRKIYRLRFPHHDGLVVRARSVPLGTFLKVTRLLDTVEASADDVKAIDDLFTEFADALIDWNVEDDDGQPVPATLDGIRGQDADFMIEVVLAWVEAIGGVPDPLPKPSPGGERSLVASLPMEPLSQSQAS